MVVFYENFLSTLGAKIASKKSFPFNTTTMPQIYLRVISFASLTFGRDHIFKGFTDSWRARNSKEGECS